MMARVRRESASGVEFVLKQCGDSWLVRHDDAQARLVGVLEPIDPRVFMVTHLATDQSSGAGSIQHGLDWLLDTDIRAKQSASVSHSTNARANYVTANAPAMLFELLKQHGCISEGKGVKLMREACTILEAAWDHAHGVEVTGE